MQKNQYQHQLSAMKNNGIGPKNLTTRALIVSYRKLSFRDLNEKHFVECILISVM